jgi:hypothetical protein
MIGPALGVCLHKIHYVISARINWYLQQKKIDHFLLLVLSQRWAQIVLVSLNLKYLLWVLSVYPFMPMSTCKLSLRALLNKMIKISKNKTRTKRIENQNKNIREKKT